MTSILQKLSEFVCFLAFIVPENKSFEKYFTIVFPILMCEQNGRWRGEPTMTTNV